MSEPQGRRSRRPRSEPGPRIVAVGLVLLALFVSGAIDYVANALPTSLPEPATLGLIGLGLLLVGRIYKRKTGQLS